MAADFSWTPPLVFLALGAVGGSVVVYVRSRYKAGGPPPAAAKTAAADLRREYDAVIRRLAEGVPEAERAELEVNAANILMRLEAAGSGAVELSVDAAKPVENSGAASAAPAPTAKATPAWVGFAYGVLTMAVLGGLFYFASQGATERSANGSPTGGMGMGGGSAAGAASDEGPGPDAPSDAEVKALEDAVTKAPRELAPRVELTRAYLRRRDLMKVFDQTQAMLEIQPGEPHALTYQALVRVAMGQADQAEKMLQDAIAKDPGIEDAYIHLAIARIQLGNREGARAAITDGQKRFPQDKDLLADVYNQLASAADGSAAPAGGPTGGAEAQGGAPQAAMAPPASAASSVARTSAAAVVVVDVPKGLSIPATAILFVIVREAGMESGAPVAVKRVAATGFPITVTLTDKDSMAGESLPGLIRVDARIDRDGDPMTKDPSDPVASEDNIRPGSGQTLLVLGPPRK